VVDQSVVPIFQNVWSFVVLSVAGFLLLTYWNIDVTPLLASAGILGIVIGLAARDTIANFFGSIALYFDGTYRVGDYIVLESGERGRVEDVSIRSTVIRTRDDILVTIPNSRLNSATVVNESAPDRERRIRIPVGVAYGSDLDHVEETLLGVAAAESLVLDRPTPRVRVRGFGDSAVDVELLCWIRDPVLRGRATHLLNKGVYAAFVETGIEIPFPQRDVHVVDGSVGVADRAGELSTEDTAVGDDD
jgi:small-conductance mechanosensitive channel